MPAPPSSADGAKASHSRSRSGPRHHLPIPIVGKASKPLVMVVESPALVLALLSKGHKPRAKSRGHNPVIPEAAAYMNNRLTDDDLFIAYVAKHNVPICAKYRMRSAAEHKVTAPRYRLSNVLDRFEEIQNSTSRNTCNATPSEPNQLLYERALEQNMQIFPTSTSILTHRHHHHPNHHNTPTNKTNKISPSGTDLVNSIRQSTISKHDPLSVFLHRATSSPLILYAAPLDHLFILQLYRLSHSAFHDKRTPLDFQAERAASLLDLIRRQNGGHVDGGHLNIEWVVSTAEKVVSGTMWSGDESTRESGMAWIADCGERGLQAVFEAVEERLYELDSSSEQGESVGG